MTVRQKHYDSYTPFRISLYISLSIMAFIAVIYHLTEPEKVQIEDKLIKASYNSNKLLHGMYEEKYDNGQMYRTGIYSNGKKDGIWLQWWRNGKLWFKKEYDQGVPNGLWIYWFDNGTLASNNTYDSEKLRVYM